MNETAGLVLEGTTTGISSTKTPLRNDCFVLPDPAYQELMDRHTSNLITATINAVSSPFAVIANFLVVFVIARNPALHTPSNVLLASLAFSDLMVGMVVQPGYVVFRLYEHILHVVPPCMLRIVYSESFWVCYGVSFLTLSAISIERYIALRLHLRYKELVTTQRVLWVAIIIWVSDISLTFMEWIAKSKLLRNCHTALLLFCLLVTFCIHIKIFWILRRHQRQINSINRMSTKRRNFQRQTRLAVSVSYIVVIYITCNIPVLCVMAYNFAGGSFSSLNVFSWSETIAFLNSLINPVICCWRNRGIRRAVLNVFAKVVCLNRALTQTELGNTSFVMRGNNRLSTPGHDRK